MVYRKITTFFARQIIRSEYLMKKSFASDYLFKYLERNVNYLSIKGCVLLIKKMVGLHVRRIGYIGQFSDTQVQLHFISGRTGRMQQL